MSEDAFEEGFGGHCTGKDPGMPNLGMLNMGPMEAEALPVWMSALEASSCQAQSRRSTHAVRWQHDSGRATYTNLGREEERIEPLGVSVPRGKTVVVTWLPGESGYTVEVYGRQ